jgi:hypothetical protein
MYRGEGTKEEVSIGVGVEGQRTVEMEDGGERAAAAAPPVPSAL